MIMILVYFSWMSDIEASFYTITFLANKIDQLDLKSIFVIDQTNLKIAQTVKET